MVTCSGPQGVCPISNVHKRAKKPFEFQVSHTNRLNQYISYSLHLLLFLSWTSYSQNNPLPGTFESSKSALQFYLQVLFVSVGFFICVVGTSLFLPHICSPLIFVYWRKYAARHKALKPPILNWPPVLQEAKDQASKNWFCFPTETIQETCGSITPRLLSLKQDPIASDTAASRAPLKWTIHKKQKVHGQSIQGNQPNLW